MKLDQMMLTIVPAAEIDAQTSTPEVKQKTVLIIEDDPDIRKPLCLRFRNSGYQVESTADGVDGVRRAKEMLPSLIILDLYLPDISGEEVCKAIREDDDVQIASIPIIMVTAKDKLSDKIVGRVIGANAYITKPFDFSDLLNEIIRLRV